MIPLGALFFCIFAGWVWGSNRAAGEIRAAGWFSRIWQLVVRFLAPAVILLILYFTVGKGQGLS